MNEHGRTPYPGLRAFESSESDLFFGREGCVDEMLSLLARTRFLAVLGTSGSGKSSLVRTGLIDALELGFLGRAGSRWLRVEMHPGGRPMRNLARALAGQGQSSAGELSASLLESFLARGPRSLVQWCEDGNLPEGANLLVLVDQFEEIFRYQDYAGRENAEAFVAMLLESARSDAPIYVVITMRSEFLGACALMPGLAEQINTSLYLTRRMTRSECKAAIEGPASVLGFDVEPRLVNRVLNDLSTFAPWEAETANSTVAQLARQADQLPLMQHVLNRLWQKASAAPEESGRLVLRYDEYEALGGLRGAVDAHAAEVVAALPLEHHGEIETVFRALVSGNSLSDAVREPRRLFELKDLSDKPESAWAVIDAFRSEGCNFLRPPTPQELEDNTVVDLAHESLIRQWSEMERWLANEARATAVWRRLVSAAEAHQAGEGDLLHGLDLANARDWWGKEAPTPSWAKRKGGDFDVVRRFLDASINAEDARAAAVAAEAARAQRSLRMRAAAYLVLAAISIAAAIFAFSSRNDALAQRAAAVKAEEATKTALGDATVARAAAMASEDFTLQAADQFLVDIGALLRRSVGIPRRDVEQAFAKADTFLDDLKGRIDDEGRLYSMRAGLALEKARDAWDRNQFETAVEQAKLAKSAIESTRAASDYDTDDVEMLLRAQFLIAPVRFPRRDALAAQVDDAAARSFFWRHRDKLSPDKINYWTARFYGYDDTDSRCLDTLAEVEAPDDAALGLRMACTASMLFADYRDDEVTDGQLNDARTALDLIPPEDRDRGDWWNWYALRNSIAAAEGNLGQDEAALRTYQGTIAQLEKLASLEPEVSDWKQSISTTYANRGVTLQGLGRSADAFQDDMKAIRTLEEMWSTVESFPNVAKQYLDLVENAGVWGENMDGWTARSDILVDLLHLRQQQRKILELMVEKGFKIDCEGCTFWPIEGEYDVHLARLKLGEDRAADEMFAAYDLLATLAWTELDPSRMDEEAIDARRSLSAATINLPFGRRAFSDNARPGDVLPVVEGAVERGERFFAQFPRDGLLKQSLGIGFAFLAELYLEAGRRPDALGAVERAVSFDSIDGIRLLAAWYQSGTGPVSIDTKRAEQLAEKLEHVGGVLQLPFLADPLWTKESDASTFTLPVWQSSDVAGSQVDEMVWRAKILDGIKLSEDDVIKLRTIEQISRESGVPFQILAAKELMGYDFEAISSVESLVAAYYKEIENAQDDDYSSSATELLSSGLGPELSRGIVLSAIDRLVKDVGHPLYGKSMKTLARLPSRWGGARFVMENLNTEMVDLLTEIEDAVSEVLVRNFAAIPNEYVSLFFRSRSEFYRFSDDEADKESAKVDVMTAAMISPDDPETLNYVGYGWIEDEELRGLAISVLERAVALFPEGSEKRSGALDSLGWAYVENGRLKEGLEKIRQAIDTSEDESGELYYHLADTYRRLGRSEEALQAIDRALALRPSLDWGESYDRVLETLELLEPERHHDAATRAAARDIVSKSTGMKLNHRTVNTDASGIAINGFDPVAYHTAGEAIRGNLVHYVIWQDAVWLFATEENKDLFESNPERYAPALGGFNSSVYRHAGEMDARLASVPFYWHIHDGKLFLFGSPDGSDEFASGGAARAERVLRDWSLSTFDTDATLSSPSPYMLLLQEAAAEVAAAK